MDWWEDYPPITGSITAHAESLYRDVCMSVSHRLDCYSFEASVNPTNLIELERLLDQAWNPASNFNPVLLSNLPVVTSRNGPGMSTY
jgi:hypothetical protein